MKQILVMAGLALFLLAARRAPVTTVEVWQDGVVHPDTMVQTQKTVSLVGSGFAPADSVKVCVMGFPPCVRIPTDDAGAFSIVYDDGFYYPGTYTFRVYQGTTDAQDPNLVYEGTFTAVDASGT